MRTYLRRLWAALLGRDFQPLDMGATIRFRGPSGEVVECEVTSVTYAVEFHQPAKLTVEAQNPTYRLRQEYT